MSKQHKPQGQPMPLVGRVQRKRAERHGKPQVMRKRTVKTDEQTGQIVIVHEWVPVPDEGVMRRVAQGSTNRYGQKNVVPGAKPKVEAKK